MPHQCVRCNHFYDDGAEELLKGCSCGARLFFFIKKSKLEEAKQEIEESIEPEQRKQIEQDVKDIMDEQEEDRPVILDFESIRIRQPGKYELDIVKLFKDDPLIFKLADGKYVIDIAESFQKLRSKK